MGEDDIPDEERFDPDRGFGFAGKVIWMLPADEGGVMRFGEGAFYNCDGILVGEPVCEVCGAKKNALIGKESFIWMCGVCATPKPETANDP